MPGKKRPTTHAARRSGRDRDKVPEFVAALRAARLAAGLTQAAVDARAGLAAGTTAQMERGVRGPTLRLALRLAGAVGLSLDQFRPPPAG